MEWHVRLSGDNYDLRDLSQVCKSEELMVEKDEEGFVLKSTEFNKLEDGEEVYKKAVELVAFINGASVVVLGVRSAVEVSRGLIMVDDEGRKNTYIVSEPMTTLRVLARGRAQTTIKKADGSTEFIYQASPVPVWVSVARRDENVARVLQMLGATNYDWPSHFYHVFEIIKGDVRDIDGKGWVADGAIKRFTRTVNSPEILGNIARHGKRGEKQPPKKPMDFHEAKRFIEELAYRWINSRLTAKSSTLAKRNI